MEKRTPHYKLTRIKELTAQKAYRVTRTALKTASRDFGFIEPDQLAEWILKLDRQDFYKSMTTLYDSTLWQDVYHSPVMDTLGYIKVQVFDDTTVIISFKLLWER